MRIGFTFAAVIVHFIPIRVYLFTIKTLFTMASVKEFAPFVLVMEAGVPAAQTLKMTLEQLFERAKRTGWANDPQDRGGATMCGVTIGTFRHWARLRGWDHVATEDELRHLSFEQWLNILKSLFWDRWQADRIHSQTLANMLVDWVWASGTPGVTIPQQVLGVKADGIVGDVTLAAINAADERTLFERLKRERLAFIDRIVARNPSQRKWVRGWKRRIHAITLDGLPTDNLHILQ